MEFPRVIYALQHEPTGKIYIGSTYRIVERVRNHTDQLKRGAHPNEAMQKDFNCYGGEYTVFILDIARKWEDRNKESLWMDALQTRDPSRGYNGCDQSKPSALTGIEGIRYPMEAGEERTLAKEMLQKAANAAMGR